MIITHEAWQALNLKDKSVVFIDGVPVCDSCLTEVAIGEKGHIVFSDAVPLVDRENECVFTRKKNGHVEIQLRDVKIPQGHLEAFGLEINTEEYQGQKIYTLVESCQHTV